jgi:hypothetical protein
MTPITPTPFPELLQRMEALRLEVGRHRTMWLLNKTANPELRADVCAELATTMDDIRRVERSIEFLDEWTNEKEES